MGLTDETGLRGLRQDFPCEEQDNRKKNRRSQMMVLNLLCAREARDYESSSKMKLRSGRKIGMAAQPPEP